MLHIVSSYTAIMHLGKVFFLLFFYLEHLEYNCTFSVAPLTRDMPPSNSIALLAANQSYSTDVWYDNIAIFSTRGCSNIYHELLSYGYEHRKVSSSIIVFICCN